MRVHDRSPSLRPAACVTSTRSVYAIAGLLFCMSLARPASATGSKVVANPGPVRLTIEFIDVRYETAPSNTSSAVGFRFDAKAPYECSDGVNNDDHSGFEQGVQDSLVDYPEDPECGSPSDDSEDKADVQERVTVVLAGTVDENGRLEFPAESLNLPPRYHRSAEHLLGGDGVVINTYEASAPVVGAIDPRRGTMSLEFRLRLRFEVEDTGRMRGPGSECYLGSASEPQRLVLIGDGRGGITGIHPARERGYYPNDGSFVLAGTNAEAVLGATCCGILCFGDGAVDRAFGIPAERGAMTVAAIGRIDPPLIAAEPASRNVKARAARPVAGELDLQADVDTLSHLGDMRDHADKTAGLLQASERVDGEVE